jgi:hypothetical protein
MALWLLEARSEPQAACKDKSEDTKQIRRMMYRAFDSAFTQQIGQLYKVYIGNAPSVEEQRAYTKKGIDNAVAAYRVGISAVNSWEC